MRPALPYLTQHRAALPWLVLAGVLILGGCANLQAPLLDDSSGPFVTPPALAPNVEFWRQVYGQWSRGQVAVHDNRYMGVIYQVATLPGSVEESYTASQREFVKALQRDWSERLKVIEFKTGHGQSLTSAEAAIKQQLMAAGGPGAWRDASQRVRTQRGLRERFGRGLEVAGRYDAAFREIFRRHGVPEDLAYLPHVESSFQMKARSSVGASGIWQFMRATGRHYMTVNSYIDERLDPVIAAEGAARYLAQAHRTLRSWPLAITAYNHGTAGMNRARKQYGDDIGRIVQHYQGANFGFASRNFYAEFLAARHVARNAAHYFPHELRPEPPLTHRRLRVEQSAYVSDLASRHGVSVDVLLRENPAWLAPIRDGRVAVPAGSVLWLPAARH